MRLGLVLKFQLLVFALVLAGAALVAWGFVTHMQHTAEASRIYKSKLLPLEKLKQLNMLYDTRVEDMVVKLLLGKQSVEDADKLFPALKRQIEDQTLAYRQLTQAQPQVEYLLARMNDVLQQTGQLLRRHESDRRVYEEQVLGPLSDLHHALDMRIQGEQNQLAPDFDLLMHASQGWLQLQLGCLALLAALAIYLIIRLGHDYDREIAGLIALTEQAMHDDFLAMPAQVASGKLGLLQQAVVEMHNQRRAQLRDLDAKNNLLAGALDELHEIEVSLRRSERRWQLALSATGDGIWEWDLERGKYYFSPRWKSMLGYLDEELANDAQTLQRLLHPEDYEWTQNLLTRFIRSNEGDAFEFECRMLHHNEGWRRILSRGVAERDNEGRVIRIVGSHTDVTEQRQVTSDLVSARISAENSLQKLRQAQEQIVESEKLAALGALVAGVAHEVNTPLGISLTAASVMVEEVHAMRHSLEEGALKKTALEQFLHRAEESTELIQKHIEHAAQLIRSFKHISVDQTADDCRQFVLDEYLQEILRSLRPSIKHTPVGLTFECPKGLVMEGYPGAFMQIISNLLHNAMIHAFDPGQAGQIALKINELNDESLEMRFSDNGRGIPPALRAKVFEPFYTTKRGAGGSGLGMSIVHNLVVARLNGTIRIEDTPGGGATIVIVFPRRLPIEGDTDNEQ